MIIHPRSIARLGWRPQIFDQRDLPFDALHRREDVQIPKVLSLTGGLPPVFDQSQLGDCVGNAAAALVAFEHGGGPYSRLQIYYNARAIEGTIGSDAGCQIRDAIKGLHKLGVAPEADWPYVISKFAQEPPLQARTAALKTRISTYSALKGRSDFQNCLAQGFPFIIGATMFDAFESDLVARTGVVPLPRSGDRPIGGHAFIVCGYDSDFQDTGDLYYECRNSYSDKWGRKGNFFIPAAYLESALASDAWTVRK